MCSPTLALTIGGLVLTAAGQIQQGVAANNQAKFQAQVAKNNAIIADRKADDARRRGDAEAAKEGRRTALAIGAQRAAGAGSGVDVNFGTLADIQEETAGFGRLDDLTIRNNAEREALGFEGQADQFRADASAAKAQGKAALTGSILGAAGTLVSPKWASLAGTPSTTTPDPTFSPGGAGPVSRSRGRSFRVARGLV